MLVQNFKRRLFSFLVSTATLVLFSAMQLVGGEQCHDVMECVDSLTNIQGLSYTLNTLNWNGDDNNVCPRSDPSVPHWQITVENGNNNDNPFTNPTYCSRGVTYSPSVVCCRNGTLIFVDLSDIHNTRGEVTFEFTTPIYNTTIAIKYAMTSVFPDEATVYFNEGDTTVHFSYFIYSSQSDLPVTVFHNGMPATDLNLFSDETSCVRSTISEFAVILIVTIINPTFASAGEYELVVDESLSAVATLVPNFSPSPPSPTASLVSPVVSSLTPLITSTIVTTTTPVVSSTEGLPMSPTSDSNLAGIISGSVVGSLVLLVLIGTCIVAIVVGYIRRCWQPGNSHGNNEGTDTGLSVLNNNTGTSDGEDHAETSFVHVNSEKANGTTVVTDTPPLLPGHTPPVVSNTPLHTPAVAKPSTKERVSQHDLEKILRDNGVLMQEFVLKELMLKEQQNKLLQEILREIKENKEISIETKEAIQDFAGKVEDALVDEQNNHTCNGLEDPASQTSELNTSVHQSPDLQCNGRVSTENSTHQSLDSKNSAHKSQELTSSTDSSQLPHNKNDQMEGEANDDNHSSTGNDGVSINDDVMDSSGSNS